MEVFTVAVTLGDQSKTKDIPVSKMHRQGYWIRGGAYAEPMQKVGNKWLTPEAVEMGDKDTRIVTKADCERISMACMALAVGGVVIG